MVTSNANNPFTTQGTAPGKLFIIGEYAVLFPKQPAILTAVNLPLTVTLTRRETPGQGHWHSVMIGSATISRRDDHIHLLKGCREDWHYVLHAVEVVEMWIQTLGHPLIDYNLSITSGLAAPNGVKYGLGSSGAVTVATIRALLSLYEVSPAPSYLIYQLAVVALLRGGSNGSFADIATMVVGEMTYYQAPCRDWLTRMIQESGSWIDYIGQDWPDLIIEALPWPDTLSIQVGWSGNPASSEDSVARLHQQVAQDACPLQQFCRDNANTVQQLREAILTGNSSHIQSAIIEGRNQLCSLQSAYHLDIETSSLTRLIEVAQNHDYVAKSSGAGGGDCGIAIGPSDSQHITALRQAWLAEGIQPLTLST